MRPEVFPYRDEFRAGFGRVRSRVYRAGAPVTDDEILLPEDCHGYVAVHEGEVKAAATVVRYSVSGPDGFLPMAGIAAVGVLPEARQSGVGSALMEGMVEALREEGYALSSLYAFRESWYRKFGYEVQGRRFEISAPGHRLPKVTSALEVRELEAGAYKLLAPTELAMAGRYLGYNARREAQWVRALGGDRPFTIYVAGDPIEAYAVLRLPDGFWGTVEVKELAWATPEGYAALIGHFRSLTVNQTEIKWPEPGDSPFVAQFLDQGVKVGLHRPLMWRAINSAGEAWIRAVQRDPNRGYCAEFF